MDIQFKGFLISDDKDKIQIDRVCELLDSTYWAKGRQRDIVEKSIANTNPNLKRNNRAENTDVPTVFFSDVL